MVNMKERLLLSPMQPLSNVNGVTYYESIGHIIYNTCSVTVGCTMRTVCVQLNL